MVYINSKGEVVDDSLPSPTNIFWKFITFIVLFFKSLVGIEDRPDRKKDNNVGGSGPISGGFHGGGGGGGSGGRPGGGKPDGNNGPRKFGPRGFKTILDFPPPAPPMGCSGGGCG